MTDDERKRLEDAILAYGRARHLLGAQEKYDGRWMAEKAANKMWDRIQEILNAYQD